MAIALMNFIPSYCPNCGTKFRIDHFDYQAHCSFTCRYCGLKFQRTETEHLKIAADMSGGDLVQNLERVY